MKKKTARKQSLISLVLMFLSCFSQLSQFANASSDQYELGITENYFLTYEYTYLNATLVEELWYIDDFYDTFIYNQQGDQLQWLIYDIDEEPNFWTIRVAKYGGENLDQFAGNFTTKAFKTPELLANDTFIDLEGAYNFIPMEVNSYLSEFSTLIPAEDSKYCSVNGSRVTFNYTAIGGFRTFIYEFNEQGMMSNLYLYDEGRFVVRFTLVSHGPNIQPYITVWVTLIIIGVISAVALYVIDRRKKKTPMHELHAIMRNARN